MCRWEKGFLLLALLAGACSDATVATSRISSIVLPIIGFGKRYPVTTGLLAMNCAVFSLQKYCAAKKGYLLEDHYALKHDAVRQGQWWRFGTSMFLHKDFLHLACNSCSLYRLRFAEESANASSARYLCLYLCSGILGNIASFAYNSGCRARWLSLGSSGALFGVMGAAFTCAIRRGKFSYRDARLNIMANYLLSVCLNVDHAAHVGGFIGGALLYKIFSS